MQNRNRHDPQAIRVMIVFLAFRLTKNTQGHNPNGAYTRYSNVSGEPQKTLKF